MPGAVVVPARMVTSVMMPGVVAADVGEMAQAVQAAVEDVDVGAAADAVNATATRELPERPAVPGPAERRR